MEGCVITTTMVSSKLYRPRQHLDTIEHQGMKEKRSAFWTEGGRETERLGPSLCKERRSAFRRIGVQKSCKTFF